MKRKAIKQFGNIQPVAAIDREHPRWRRVIAGAAGISIALTYGVVTNRPMDPGIREQSYVTETMDGFPGSGGQGVIEEGESATTTTTARVVAPAKTITETETISYNNLPADSTPDMNVIKQLPGILANMVSRGFTIKQIKSIGESSDYITYKYSLGVPEPETGKPQKDWAVERSEVGGSASKDTLMNTPWGNFPVFETTDQDVLTKKQLIKFNIIAKSLGYKTAHELASAVLGGRDTRSDAVDSVQKYIRDEMGTTIEVIASKEVPAKIEYVVVNIPGIPPVEIPYYNPYPAAWWNPVSIAEEPKYPGRPIIPTDRSDRTAQGRTVAPAWRRKQPGDPNDGGNRGPRGQRNTYPHSARTSRRIAAKRN